MAIEATITYMNRNPKFKLNPNAQQIAAYMSDKDVTAIHLKRDDVLSVLFQRIYGNSWMLTDVENEDVYVGDNIDVLNYYMDEGVWTCEYREEPRYYNPAEYNGAYELFVNLSSTEQTLRVASGNYRFLVKIAIGYLLTEPNLYNMQVNLWGEFVIKHQRLGNGNWETILGYGESIMHKSDDMLLGYLKGLSVAPIEKEFNQ